MSRSYKDSKNGQPWPDYDKESNASKKLWRRKRRREGKRLMQEDNPDKGTQGWMTH